MTLEAAVKRTEKTPSETDWEKAERKATPLRRRCAECGEYGHTYKTCPKMLREKTS